MNIDPDSTFWGIKLSHLWAGAVGGLMRALLKPREPIYQHVSATVIGTVVAGYATPTVGVLLDRYAGTGDIPDASIEGMAGFLLGLCGMTLCEALIRRVKKWGAGEDIKPPPATKSNDT
jgi:hypothetical protein